MNYGLITGSIRGGFVGSSNGELVLRNCNNYSSGAPMVGYVYAKRISFDNCVINGNFFSLIVSANTIILITNSYASNGGNNILGSQSSTGTEIYMKNLTLDINMSGTKCFFW